MLRLPLGRSSLALGFGCAALAFMSVVLIAACGDDDDDTPPSNPVNNNPDGGSPADGSNPQPGDDASGGDDTGTGGQDAGPFVLPTATAIPLSVAGPDQLQSVVANPSGGFYAAGFAAQTVGGPRMIIVVKLTAAGALDATWATGGIATSTLVFAGSNDEIDIGIQPSGKIVVSATIADANDPEDTNIGLIRFNADGSPDGTFAAGAGTALVDLNTAINTPRVGKDTSRALAIAADGSIFLHAGGRNAGALRADLDFTIVKLTVDGVPATFGTNSRYTLDIAEENATPRGIIALPDGSIIAGGYANSTVVASKVQPVVYKVSATGTIVGTPFHQTVLTEQTEVYGLAFHGTHVITGGYGRNTGTNDWVSMKFDVANLARDTSFGGAPNGAVLFDVSNNAVADNCRNAVALPNGKTLLIGSTNGANETGAMDAAFAVLDSFGGLDTAYGVGRHFLTFGGAGNDQLWGAAVSGSIVLMVGYRGVVAAQVSDTVNDDAFAMVMPLR